MNTAGDRKVYGKKSDAEEWLHEAAGLSVYYEYYGALLPEKQPKEYGLSRQGVYDAVRRCGAKLHEYEEKLRLAERFGGLEEQAERIRALAERLSGSEDPETAAAGKDLAATAQELWERLQ